MTLQRASDQVLTRTMTRRRRIPTRSCYRCYGAFGCTSPNARVYCPACQRRYGFPEPEARCA